MQVVTTSMLRVTVTPDPWTMSFGVLDTAGPVGFQVARRGAPGPTRDLVADPPDGPWLRATRVRHAELADDGYRAELDTDDPDGRVVSLRVAPLDDATLSVTVEVAGASVVAQPFVAVDGERFYGFGERSNTARMERGVVENYVGEGPFQPHEYAFLTGTVPPWGIRERQDATYFPVPWVLSTRGYGILIDEDEISYERFRTRAEDEWSIEVESGRLSYRLFAGPTPLEALGRYTAAIGRQPEPARWFFGPWFQSGHANHVPLDEERRQVKLLRGAPASAAETHCRYLPLGEDRGYEDDERARVAHFHAEGLAALSYLNPLVGAEYTEAFDAAVALGALQRDRSGAPYTFQGYVGDREPPHTAEAQYDFTSTAGRDCWGAIAARIVSAGYDGWMEDFGEYTPLDVVQADGSEGSAAHNRYPTDYHSAASVVAGELERRHGRRLARFARSGWTGTAAVVPIVWGGDPSTSWGFDGLLSAVSEGISMGASGVSMWGSDTGGFFSSEERLTPELLRRWIQFSAFCPVMRTKAGGIELPPYQRPQIWDDDVLPTWRHWARWHIRLNDYLMASHARYRATGRPIICAVELAHPEVCAAGDEYLLGEDLLVAPVVEPECRSRVVTFPEGLWFDLFEPSRSFSGPATKDVAVGPDDIPVFVRAGAVLGLLPDEVESLSPYASEPEDRRDVLAFPSGSSGNRDRWSGSLGPGVDCTSELTRGTWTLELSATRPFHWDISAWLPREPSVVAVGDRASTSDTDAWTFDTGMFRAQLNGPSPVVRVRMADSPRGV